MGRDGGKGDRDGWARLRFAVVGPLLASPPPKGRLRAELERLAQQSWEHPTGGGQVRFSASTIERWYYQARSAHQDPVKALRRRARTDVGRVRKMSPSLIAALRDQYRDHPSWSVQLHHDNLQAQVEADPSLGPMSSYATLTRVMRSLGLERRRRRRRFEKEPERPAVEAREVLSYEVSRSHALWHGDFHHGRRRVLTASGEWRTPILLGFLDDHSRLGCHLQWYLAETAEVFVHGLCQAFMKRGLPKSLLTDNGAPMMAGEVQEGRAGASARARPPTPPSGGRSPAPTSQRRPCRATPPAPPGSPRWTRHEGRASAKPHPATASAARNGAEWPT